MSKDMDRTQDHGCLDVPRRACEDCPAGPAAAAGPAGSGVDVMGEGGDQHPPQQRVGLSPVLLRDESLPSADGAALACPQCTGTNLHLDTIRYATPADGHYTPTIGVSIDGTQVAVDGEDNDEALRLHAGANRGAMLAIGYWCENGCRGRIELREHKGYLFASLHKEPFGPPDYVLSAINDATATAVDPDTQF